MYCNFGWKFWNHRIILVYYFNFCDCIIIVCDVLCRRALWEIDIKIIRCKNFEKSSFYFSWLHYHQVYYKNNFYGQFSWKILQLIFTLIDMIKCTKIKVLPPQLKDPYQFAAPCTWNSELTSLAINSHCS